MTFICRFMALLFLALSGTAVALPAFERVAPGMEYREIRLERPRPLVMSQLRCDPAKVRFQLLLASDNKGKSQVSRADEMVRRFGLLAAINCSYFGHENELLGYHERLGHPLNPEVTQDGLFGGFFYWDGRRAGLKGRGEARPTGVPLLFQAGPRLVWDGRAIPGLETTARAARSGVAVDRQGRATLFVLAYPSTVTLAELPPLLSAPVDQGGVAAWRALNFDGGSSTQFSLKTGAKTVSLPGASAVPAFLGVRSR